MQSYQNIINNNNNDDILTYFHLRQIIKIVNINYPIMFCVALI